VKKSWLIDCNRWNFIIDTRLIFSVVVLDVSQGCPVASSDILRHGIFVCSDDCIDSDLRRNFDCPLLPPAFGGRSSMVVAFILQQCQCRILFVLILPLVPISETRFGWHSPSYGVHDIYVYDLYGLVAVLRGRGSFIFILVYKNYLWRSEGRLNKFYCTETHCSMIHGF